MTDPTPRLVLRQLPLPARLVLSGFLLSVGLGYFSALVQLHMQHGSRDGEPLPSPADVVEVFAGLKKVDPNLPPPVSKLEKLVLGPIDGAAWNGAGSMAAAFYHRDGADYKDQVKAEPENKPKLDADRAGEQQAVAKWCRLPDGDRRAAFEADAVPFPADQPLTADFRAGETAKVKTILTERCARCHAKGAEQESYPLEVYDQFVKYLHVPTLETRPGGWVRSDRQVSVEKLTQSTHAHLLSFAMLFSLTGLIFAFTHYPTGVRLVVAPLVLLAQMADVSCWWLARVDGVGPYFAMGIVGTGTVVGLGLLTHILGGLWSLYGRAGRGVLLGLALVAVGGAGVLYTTVIGPQLAAERASKQTAAAK